MALIDKDKSPYVLECNDCRHRSFLTSDQYAKQLQDKTYDGFICPHCGSEDCYLDEVHYQNVMGVPRRGV